MVARAALDCWKDKGFGEEPEPKTAPEGGVMMYRCWGGSSTEWGTGYFSATKPASVVDAEMRYNIVDRGNAVYFVTSFRLKEGFRYVIGPVAHGPRDIFTPAVQIYVAPPLPIKIAVVTSRELLKQDATVVLLNDRGTIPGRGRA